MSTSNVRTFDENGLVRRAGCLIFKDKTHKEVLLVTSRKNYLIAPAGGIEPGESIYAAALREAKEEAGVVGNIGEYLGSFKSSRKSSVTHMYVMYMTDFLPDDQWTEYHLRKRMWVKRGDTNEKLSPELQEYFAKFDIIFENDNEKSILISA